jgi:hypothetical protein
MITTPWVVPYQKNSLSWVNWVSSICLYDGSLWRCIKPLSTLNDFLFLNQITRLFTPTVLQEAWTFYAPWIYQPCLPTVLATRRWSNVPVVSVIFKLVLLFDILFKPLLKKGPYRMFLCFQGRRRQARICSCTREVEIRSFAIALRIRNGIRSSQYWFGHIVLHFHLRNWTVTGISCIDISFYRGQNKISKTPTSAMPLPTTSPTSGRSPSKNWAQ